MKVGDSLGSEGRLSSVLGVRACSRASRYPNPWKEKMQNFNTQGCHEWASDRMQWCRSAFSA